MVAKAPLPEKSGSLRAVVISGIVVLYYIVFDYCYDQKTPGGQKNLVILRKNYR